MIKLKSQKSKKFFTNYVKRYFTLDLDQLSLSYRSSDKPSTDKKTFNLNNIKRIHQHSKIGLLSHLSKSLMLEWQFDFMIEFNSSAETL